MSVAVCIHALGYKLVIPRTLKWYHYLLQESSNPSQTHITTYNYFHAKIAEMVHPYSLVVFEWISGFPITKRHLHLNFNNTLVHLYSSELITVEFTCEFSLSSKCNVYSSISARLLYSKTFMLKTSDLLTVSVGHWYYES